MKNEKNILRNRGYNKNNESRFGSHIGGSVFRSKLGDNSSYKTSMMKALGETEADDKIENNDKTAKTTIKKNDKKEDVKKK